MLLKYKIRYNNLKIRYKTLNTFNGTKYFLPINSYVIITDPKSWYNFANSEEKTKHFDEFL